MLDCSLLFFSGDLSFLQSSGTWKESPSIRGREFKLVKTWSSKQVRSLVDLHSSFPRRHLSVQSRTLYYRLGPLFSFLNFSCVLSVYVKTLTTAPLDEVGGEDPAVANVSVGKEPILALPQTRSKSSDCPHGTSLSWSQWSLS